MASRDDSALTRDIAEAIQRIQIYAAGLTYQEFLADTKSQDAIVRNLEIIGEAAKKLSPEFRDGNKSLPWHDIAGMRDRLIHHYFGTNWEIVWDVIQTKLPSLQKQLIVPKKK